MSFKSFWGSLSLPASLHEIPKKVKTREIIKPSQDPQKYTQTPINTPKTLTLCPRGLIVVLYTFRSTLMSVVYQQAQKQRYRITLDLQVLGDFDPHQLDWEKLFKLEPAEKCEAYVEDLNAPERW
jgi:hypothetical protein